MWGATLFFITIVFVTQCGRDAAVAYISQILSQPCPPLSLVCMALGTLASLFVMRRRAPRPGPYWVWQVVQGEVGEAAHTDSSTAESVDRR
jgi:hypothetical protein